MNGLQSTDLLYAIIFVIIICILFFFPRSPKRLGAPAHNHRATGQYEVGDDNRSALDIGRIVIRVIFGIVVTVSIAVSGIQFGVAVIFCCWIVAEVIWFFGKQKQNS